MNDLVKTWSWVTEQSRTGTETRRREEVIRGPPGGTVNFLGNSPNIRSRLWCNERGRKWQRWYHFFFDPPMGLFGQMRWRVEMVMINEKRPFFWVVVKRSKANTKCGFARDRNFSKDKGTATKHFKHTTLYYHTVTSPLDSKLTQNTPKGLRAIKQ